MADARMVMDPESEVMRDENARMASFVGAIAIADLVKTTLGPKGMDKILASMENGSVQVTNDGATILKSVYIDNPAAKVLVDMSKTQDDEVGDGTTSVVVLAGELLRQAEALTQKRIHPMTIVEGWRMAAVVARKALAASAVDHGEDAAAFRRISSTSRARLSALNFSTKTKTSLQTWLSTLCFDSREDRSQIDPGAQDARWFPRGLVPRRRIPPPQAHRRGATKSHGQRQDYGR